MFGLFDGPIQGNRSAIMIDVIDAAALLWCICAVWISVIAGRRRRTPSRGSRRG
jgi:hypothetical protein